MSAAHISAIFQRCNIPSNGGNGRKNMLGKLFQRGKFGLLKIFLNPFLTFFGLHFNSYGRF